MKRAFGTAVTLMLAASIVLGVVVLFQKPDESAAPPPTPLGMDLPISPWDGVMPFQEGVGLFTIYGPLFVEHEASFPFGAGSDNLVRRLKRFARQKQVRALVLRINSPGGSVGASQEIYEAIQEIRKGGIPVVASFADVAASGGYYIASASDSIVANPGSITGSIGVIIGSLDLSRLMKRWDIGFNIIKSKEHKDILAYWREMSPEERKMLQQTVDRVYRQFLKVVSDGRRMPMGEVEKLADGSIVSGEEALKIGLVDRLGTLQDAIRLAGEMAGLSGEPHVILERPGPADLLSMMFANVSKQGSIEGVHASPPVLPVSYTYDPSGGVLSGPAFARILSALAASERP